MDKLGKNHVEIASLYNNIALVYSRKNLEVANTYNNIALNYYTNGEEDYAVDFYLNLWL